MSLSILLSSTSEFSKSCTLASYFSDCSPARKWWTWWVHINPSFLVHWFMILVTNSPHHGGHESWMARTKWHSKIIRQPHQEATQKHRPLLAMCQRVPASFDKVLLHIFALGCGTWVFRPLTGTQCACHWQRSNSKVHINLVARHCCHIIGGPQVPNHLIICHMPYDVKSVRQRTSKGSPTYTNGWSLGSIYYGLLWCDQPSWMLPSAEPSGMKWARTWVSWSCRHRARCFCILHNAAPNAKHSWRWNRRLGVVWASLVW